MARTHGMHGTPEYVAYRSARKRCINPKTYNYKNYGGRGIEFRFESFGEFFAEVGPRPSPDHSIDRINNDGHYIAGNLRWSTRTEQMRNRRKGLPRLSQTHCPLGHAYTPENILRPEEVRKADGKRRCRQCYKEYRRRETRRKNVKQFARDRLNTAVRRLTKRLNGSPLLFLYGLPPIIPHDCFPTRWPVNEKTALLLAQHTQTSQRARSQKVGEARG
jgi:hypothetical protein